jgi:hypothetical protein
MKKANKTMPLPRPDGGLAFTYEDKAWQIYRLRAFKMSDDEIKKTISISNAEFDLYTPLIPKLDRRFEAKMKKGI